MGFLEPDFGDFSSDPAGNPKGSSQSYLSLCLFLWKVKSDILKTSKENKSKVKNHFHKI